VARDVGRKILDSVDVLRAFPRIGLVYRRSWGESIREIVCGPYRVFYEVDDLSRSVRILAVWHAARRGPTRSALRDRAIDDPQT